MNTKRVLIVGGGFAGIETARRLAQAKNPNLAITLISNKTYFEYYPALYRVVTGASPIEVCIPLTDMIPDTVEILLDTVIDVNVGQKEVRTISGKILTGDYLVLALGSETTYFNLPGIDTLSLGFKSVKEAVLLKEHLASLFESHEHPSVSELVSHFHIVIVGGGPSGVEVAGDLAIYMRKLARKHSVDESLITIDLIESNARLLPMLPAPVSKRVERTLRLLGVNIFLNRQLVSEEVEQVYLKDMSMKSKTVIWTAGTQINQLFKKIEGLTFSAKKRIEVNEYLEATGFSDIYVVGDPAQTPYSGLAQTAIYDGKYVGSNILRKIHGRRPRKYSPKKVAYSIPVGESWGVFIWHGIRIYGVLAYWIRHAIDFLYFGQILPPSIFFRLFFEGYKYRFNFNKKLK